MLKQAGHFTADQDLGGGARAAERLLRAAPAHFESVSEPRSSGGLSPAADVTDKTASSSGSGIAGRLPDLGVAIKSIVAFWLTYMVLITLRAIVIQQPDFWEMVARRAVAMFCGMGITFVVYLMLRPLASATLNRKATIAGLLCLPASMVFATVNYALFYVYAPLDAARLSMWKMKGMSPAEIALNAIAEGTLSWYFLFAAWAAVYVAMSYAAQLRASDRRAAAFAREAQEAQLRALRYQINPHFLFNTLNSLSSLILAQRTDTAEQMIMNLSTFFRTTLSADPTADVSLEEEIRLQRLYLDIEQVRFPERLRVEIDIPPELGNARVPVLILQPIVENAIKYGVARSKRPVTIRISAEEEAGRLHIEVTDDGDVMAKDPLGSHGEGVGLANVCDRLTARYGDDAACSHGQDPEGGYTTHIALPVVRNG
ncbi:MAG TPA: sensor histidine kinase, partial [Allosphingosinicella sp.]